LSARPSSGGTELDRVRTALEQERHQRQRLEKKLQEMAAPQAVMSREQSVDDLPGRFTAPTGAATGVRESNTTQSRADEELKQQLQAMSAEAAGLREALEKKQKERVELVGRIFADGAELEQVRTALEKERAQRQQLETSLQEMTANQAGQVVEPKPVGTESSEQWNATETARLEEGPRSIREELTGLQQQRDELSSQLVLAQQAAAGSQQHSTGLETRLWETTEDLERARIELEQERAERQQLETSLQEMTANQAGQVVEPKPVETESREARRQDDPPLHVALAILTGLQQQRDELSSQLALAQQAAAESQQHSTASEARLRETTEDLERARAELEQEGAQRERLEKELGEMATAEAAERQGKSLDDSPVRITSAAGS